MCRTATFAIHGRTVRISTVMIDSPGRSFVECRDEVIPRMPPQPWFALRIVLGAMEMRITALYMKS